MKTQNSKASIVTIADGLGYRHISKFFDSFKSEGINITKEDKVLDIGNVDIVTFNKRADEILNFSTYPDTIVVELTPDKMIEFGTKFSQLRTFISNLLNLKSVGMNVLIFTGNGEGYVSQQLGFATDHEWGMIGTSLISMCNPKRDGLHYVHHFSPLLILNLNRNVKYTETELNSHVDRLKNKIRSI